MTTTTLEEEERFGPAGSPAAPDYRGGSSFGFEFTDRRAEGATRSLDCIAETKKQIAKARKDRASLHVEKAEKVLDLVLSSFRKRGEFFYDAVHTYLFLKSERIVIPIDFTEEALELALADYNLFPNEEIARQVIHALRLHGRKEGRKTEVHAFSHYDRGSNILYIYDFAGGVYRLTAKGIERVSNGTDGVLFLQKSRWTPLELKFGSSQAPDWRSWLLSGVTFAPGSLSEADQRLLLSFWILTLFFPESFPTRIILAVIGEKGSGKTSLLKRVGQLLFGAHFDVSALTAKQDDFDAAITAEPFVVADNADDAPGWFSDKLAVVATGGTIKRRILYTTNRLGEFRILANVAVTSRTPNFTREDVAERLLPLRVARLEKNKSEAVLQAEVEERRNEIMSAIVTDAWRCVVALEEQKDTVFETKFRMADFAEFVLKVASVLSTREEVERLLTRLSEQQVSLASEDEPILGLVEEWLKDESHVNIEREIGLKDLGSELERIAGDRPVPWQRGNAKSFGQYVRAREGTLKTLYGMTSRMAHAGTMKVSFNRGRGGDLGERTSSSPIYQYEFERVGELK